MTNLKLSNQKEFATYKQLKKLPISVFIIAQDEEDRITSAIKSVIGWVDEVIIIDSGSQDSTVDISKSLGANVLYRKWQGYGQQKVFGEAQCRNNWILNIDADEEVTIELRDEIIELFRDIKESDVYRIKRVFIGAFNDGKVNFFSPSSSTVRFYNKLYSGFSDSTVHESVILKKPKVSKIKQLHNIILHRSYRSYSHSVFKMNEYSTMQAQDLFDKGKNPSCVRIIVEPFFAFFKSYILRKYFLFGMGGVIESMLYSFSRVLRLMKAKELFLQDERKRNQV